MFAAVLALASVVTTCELHPAGDRWQGSCGTNTLTIAKAKAITSGVWRKDAEPVAVWSGTMGDPVELELYDGGAGILRTSDGWFAVTSFVSNAESVHFQFDSSHEVPPSDLDREIVRRAAVMISSSAVWNRADNRKCAKDAKTWSIYCAMEQATIDVTGAFHHRRPALQVVRELVDKRSEARDYQHRLMDYNNDPSTRFEAKSLC